MTTTLFDPDAESAVLGSLLVYGWLTESVLDILKPSDFWSQDRQDLFQALVDTFERTPKAVDLTTVSDTLRRNGIGQNVIDYAALEALTYRSRKPDNLIPNARIVLDFAIRRDMALAGRQIEAAAQDHTLSPYELSGLADGFVRAAERADTHGEPINMGALILEALNRNVGDAGEGIRTGYGVLDTMTGGLRPGEMTIVAGRPSMGKSSLALNIASRCVDSDVSVLFISLETPADQIAANLVALRCLVNGRVFQRNKLQPSEADRVCTEGNKLDKQRKFMAMDCSTLTPNGLRGIVRSAVKKHKTELVIIDYLQLMEDPRRRESRQQEVSSISRTIKAIAKEYHIPIIAVAQLTRGLERRESRRPVMSDLRESGALEQDADVILLLHREAYYGKTPENDGLATLIVAKNRNGPTGDVNLCFTPEHLRFESLAWSTT